MKKSFFPGVSGVLVLFLIPYLMVILMNGLDTALLNRTFNVEMLLPVIVASEMGSEYEMEVQTVVVGIGTSPNPLIKNTTEGLETNKHGCIIAQEPSGLTSREGVYAGGDAVTGAATVILAMGAGKDAAGAIDEYIQNKNK